MLKQTVILGIHTNLEHVEPWSQWLYPWFMELAILWYGHWWLRGLSHEIWYGYHCFGLDLCTLHNGNDHLIFKRIDRSIRSCASWPETDPLNLGGLGGLSDDSFLPASTVAREIWKWAGKDHPLYTGKRCFRCSRCTPGGKYLKFLHEEEDLLTLYRKSNGAGSKKFTPRCEETRKADTTTGRLQCVNLTQAQNNFPV